MSQKTDNSIAITVLCFGIAYEIVGKREFSADYKINTLGELRQELISQFPELKRLSKLSLAVNEVYQQDNFCLSSKDTVAIIPPVSGG